MFTWICPQCGREVPPAYNECPDCNPRPAAPVAAAAPPPPQEAPPPPAQTGGFGGSAQTSQAAPPPAPSYAPPPVAPAYEPPRSLAYAPPAPAPPARSHAAGPVLPTWLLAVLFAFAFFGVIAGIHWLIESRGQTSSIAIAENPAAKAGANANPFQKFIELSGVRFQEDPKHKDATLVKFVVVNHADTEIPGLSANVSVWGRTHKSGEEAQGTFAFTTNMAPFETKEVTVPLTTKLKIYELPDWQYLNLDLQITAPGGGASGGSPAPR
jgi:hypothetical protein